MDAAVRARVLAGVGAYRTIFVLQSCESAIESRRICRLTPRDQ